MRVKESMNYEMFQVNPINRPITDTTRLEQSFLKHGWIDFLPLYCTPNGSDKLLIRIGHHRFHVAKKLNIPVKYVVMDKEIGVHELETTYKKWKLSDYLVSFVRAGFPEYIKVYEYWKRTSISLTAIISILGGLKYAAGGETIMYFISGDFIVNKDNYSKEVEEIVKECRALGFKDASFRSFVLALLKILPNPDFQVYRFIKKINAHSFMLKKQASQEQYIELIEAIYNRHANKKVSLSFAAQNK